MEEEFSYLPYISYPLAGISTFTLMVMILMRSWNKENKPSPQERGYTKHEEPKTDSNDGEKKKYETLG